MYILCMYLCPIALYVRPSLANFSDDYLVISKFECHREKFVDTLELVCEPTKIENHWSTYFAIAYYTFTSPSLTCRLTFKLSN